MSRKNNINQIIQSFIIFRKGLIKNNNIKITLPYSQDEALHCIFYNNELTVSELASCLRITSGAATQLTDALINSGCILRTPDSEDRRVIHLKLSSKGKQVVSKSIKEKLDHFNKILAPLDDIEVESLSNILGKISKSIKEKDEK